jgi:hypothetical protein
MIAKWYQNASNRLSPRVPEKMCAMPTASEGAPPVRASRLFSPTMFARSCICSALTGYPQEVMVAVAATGLAPTTPAGLLMAK